MKINKEVKTWEEVARPFREVARKSGFTKEALSKIIIKYKK